MFQVYMLYISSLFSHIYKEYVLYCIMYICRFAVVERSVFSIDPNFGHKMVFYS